MPAQQFGPCPSPGNMGAVLSFGAAGVKPPAAPLAISCFSIQAAPRTVPPVYSFGAVRRTQSELAGGMVQWELAARCAGSPDPQPSQRLLATHCAGRRVPRDRWPVMAKPIGGTACTDETHPAPQRLKAKSYFRNKTTLCFAPFDTY